MWDGGREGKKDKKTRKRCECVCVRVRVCGLGEREDTGA